MSARRFALISALPLLAACTTAGDSSWAGTITDSAGVSIVQNPAEGMWAPGQAWTVQEELSIGEMGGDANYQFGQVSGVDVDDAGNVYVADQQAREIRIYDATGKYVRTVGKPGSGPGEIGANSAGLEVVGDQIFVPDLGNQRLSRFSLEGEPRGDTHVDFAKAIPVRWDELPAGRIVAQVRHLAFNEPDAAPTGDAIVAVNADGTFGDTVGMLPAGETVTVSGGVAKVKMFQPEPVWDADGTGVVVSGRNNALRLEVRDADGVLKRIVERATTPKPVTDRDKKLILDALRDLVHRQSPAAPAPAIEAYINSIQFADNWPAFLTVALGPQGSIWTQRIRSAEELAGAEGTFDPQDLGSNAWDVFDGEGRYLGMVTFPGRYQPVRVVGDRFYGVARDDLDVQSIKVYRLITG